MIEPAGATHPVSAFYPLSASPWLVVPCFPAAWCTPQQGHMVPMDQPAAALDMITRFTRGKKLAEAVSHDGAASGRGVQEEGVASGGREASADAKGIRMGSRMMMPGGGALVEAS